MMRLALVFLAAFFLSSLALGAPRAHAELDLFADPPKKEEPAAAEGGGGEAAAEGGEKGAEGEHPHPKYAYINLQSVTLPIITEQGLTQQLSVGLSLEVPWEQKKEFEAYEPRLIDAYIQDLYGAMGAGFGIMKSGVVDIVAVKERMVRVTERVLGPDLKPHDVLLQVVQQQPK